MDAKEFARQDRYQNPSITFLINTTIIEYDMKDAGLSIIKKYKLLPKDTIENLDRINRIQLPDNPKEGKRLANIEIGKMEITNTELREGLKKGFYWARKHFIKENALEEKDILSVKKDAIFVLRSLENPDFDKYIRFREKNIYHGYLKINAVELYYKGNGELDIKHLGSTAEEVHKNYFLAFLVRFFKRAEQSTKSELLLFLRRFLDRYKRFELSPEYYIQFRSNGRYVYLDGTTSSIEERGNLRELDISYNYKIIITLVNGII